MRAMPWGMGWRRNAAAQSLFAMLAAFATYSSMYAFRKPFTAGTYAGMSQWGIDYKILLITAQVLGYMLSKFIGIKVVSEIQPMQRIRTIGWLMGIAGLSLLFFALTPYPYQVGWLFLNGLPLGMMWGLVFSFLEGRRNTELLGAAMAGSFVVSSGMVKSVGRFLMDQWHISEFWMPFLSAALFIPPLLLGLWMLYLLPAPDPTDILHRSPRSPMDAGDRKAFFQSFAPGIVFSVLIYTALTIFRDVRDNFSVEIWTELGFPNNYKLLLASEIPIAVGVFLCIGAMIFIRNNRTAFYANLGIVILGGLVLFFGTWLFETGLLPPIFWMILVGFGMYLAYISFHTMLFERWIALFRIKSNSGFLMYLADAFGYLGSISILFYKNFGENSGQWLSLLIRISYLIGVATVVLGLLAVIYFLEKEKSPASN